MSVTRVSFTYCFSYCRFLFGLFSVCFEESSTKALLFFYIFRQNSKYLTLCVTLLCQRVEDLIRGFHNSEKDRLYMLF